MKKAVVTGGAGFIGSHIVDGLIAAEYQVAVIDNLSSGSKENLNPRAELFEVDIRTEEARRIIEKVRPGAVVHTAAQISVRESMRDPLFDVEVNVAGLVNLLCACRDSVKPHFVFLSTGGAIYGEQDTFPAAEDHPVRPNSIYGQSKRVGEIYLEFWARELGLSFTALRLANVYGPRQNPHGEAGVVAIFNQYLLSGKQPLIYGSGEQTRDFVYVKDVAAAALAVITQGIPGIFNIGTGKETSVNQLYSEIAAALESKVSAAFAPKKEGEQMRSCIDASCAKRTFGWVPSRRLADGIRETCDWFRAQHR